MGMPMISAFRNIPFLSKFFYSKPLCLKFKALSFPVKCRVRLGTECFTSKRGYHFPIVPSNSRRVTILNHVTNWQLAMYVSFSVQQLMIRNNIIINIKQNKSLSYLHNITLLLIFKLRYITVNIAVHMILL